MPIVSIKVIEGVLTTEQKRDLLERVTDAVVSVAASASARSRRSSSRKA